MRFFRGWIVTLLCALFLIAWDSAGRVRHLREMQAGFRGASPSAESDASSATGFGGGRRTLVLPNVMLDTDHWIMQTQYMLASGDWRVRSVDYDNAPDGREVHWASLPRWWMGLNAFGWERLTGVSRGEAVEDAVLLMSPLLLALALLIGAPIIARELGGAAASLLVMGVVTCFPIYLYFAAGRAEHHGSAILCALSSLLCLAIGHGPEQTAARSRRWITLSAIFGGVGVWVSAASLIPILFGIGLGAACSTFLAEARVPGLWRRWGIAGAATLCVTYIVEYFPSHFGWHLEVNHPLYAVAWIGGAELIEQLSAWRYDRRGRRFSSREALRVIVAMLALSSPVVAILVGGSRMFVLGDSFLWRLHTSFIAEFQSVSSYIRRSSFAWETMAQLLPMLLIIPAAWLVLRKGTPAETRSRLALVVVPAVVECVLATGQIRWLGFAGGLALVCGAVYLSLARDRKGVSFPRRKIWRALCFLLLAPGAIAAVELTRYNEAFTVADLENLAVRDLCDWLRFHGLPERAVVLSTPDTTTRLIYNGGFRGLGTFYWENAAGLKAAADIFASTDLRRVREELRRRGVVVIVLDSWDPFVMADVKLADKLPVAGAIPSDCFGSMLMNGKSLPSWLTPIPYMLPPAPALRARWVRVFEVTDP